MWAGGGPPPPPPPRDDLRLSNTNGILKKIIFVIDMVLTDPTENFFVVSVTIYFLWITQLRSKRSPSPTRPCLAPCRTLGTGLRIIV